MVQHRANKDYLLPEKHYKNNTPEFMDNLGENPWMVLAAVFDDGTERAKYGPFIKRLTGFFYSTLDKAEKQLRLYRDGEFLDVAGRRLKAPKDSSSEVYAVGKEPIKTLDELLTRNEWTISPEGERERIEFHKAVIKVCEGSFFIGKKGRVLTRKLKINKVLG